MHEGINPFKVDFERKLSPEKIEEDGKKLLVLADKLKTLKDLPALLERLNYLERLYT